MLSVRPEHVRPAADGRGIAGTLRSRQFLGTYAEWWVDVGQTSLRAFVDPYLPADDEVRLVATDHRWVREDTP